MKAAKDGMKGWFRAIGPGIITAALVFGPSKMTGGKVTDMNAAPFDVKNQFKGSIAGIQEMLRWNRLLEDV